MKKNSYNDGSILYLVPTPIGNLEDMTVRAINTLKNVDYILCEDTRTSGSILKKFSIKNKLIAHHEFNEEKVANFVVEELTRGCNIAIITDRGTPIISDPGYKVVQKVIKNNFSVVSLPGATAFVPALTMSGLTPSPFTFYGFLNAKENKRKKELENLKFLQNTIIFYEAPHRLMQTLNNILEILGDRQIVVCREISKIHEEVCRGKITEVQKELNIIKGEFVIVLEGYIPDYVDLSLKEHIELYLKDGMSANEAIKKVALERGIAKSIIYKEYHKSK